MSGRHIFNLPKTTEVRNASNVRKNRTDFTYDVGSLANTSGVISYDQTYNPFSGNYNSTTAKRGNVTKTRTYTNASNLTGAIDYSNTYDITGNNITATTNCCQQISTLYNSATKFAYPVSVIRGASSTSSPDRVTISATHDFNTGAIKTVTDANGRISTAVYDSIGRQTQITLSTGGKTTYEYFPNTLATKETTKLSNNVTVRQSTSIVNGRGQLQVSKLLTGTSAETATKIKYDVIGRRWQESNPYPAASSPTKWTTYAYDNLSRVTNTTTPDGSTSKTFYNETTKPSSALTTAGSTVRSQDAWGRERWARSDDWGRIVELVEPNANGNGSVIASGNQVTRYTYDAVDQLTQIIQGSQTRKFKYDSLGRTIRQKLAEHAATINDAGAYVGVGGSGTLWSDSLSYDDRSNLTQRIDARGVKTNFSYLKSGSLDPLNRLQSISFDKTGADTTHTIHNASSITYIYMATGDKERISSVTSSGVSTETYTYDVEARISNYKMLLASRTSYPMDTTYSYDTANRLTSVTYPKQYGMSGNPRKTVNITYDQTSRLKDLKIGTAAQMDQITYNDFGQATSIRIGGGTANPLTEEYTFDANNGLLRGQKVKRGSTTLMNLYYGHGRTHSTGAASSGTKNGVTGNLTHAINYLDRNKDRVYEYDALGRLRNGSRRSRCRRNKRNGKLDTNLYL